MIAALRIRILRRLVSPTLPDSLRQSAAGPDEARSNAGVVRKNGSYAADVYAALGDYDAAFTCLEERYARRDFSLAQVATAVLFIDLHGDRRFQDLLGRMGYPR